MSIAEILSNRMALPTHSAPSTSSNTFRLKLQPPQKHVDKSQKQQFIVEFPLEASSVFGNVAAVNIDRRHFLPPVLLTGIAKQQKEEKGKNGSSITAHGELSIQILSREDKEITFDKCERCQEKDSHIFPLFEKDSHDERDRQHPRNCFALIGCDKAQFDKGKAIIPIYFRCCPTHHTSKKGENFVKMKVAITKGNTVFESEFVKVQWKKGKHSRAMAPAAKPAAASTPINNSNPSSNTTTYPETNTALSISMPSTVPTQPLPPPPVSRPTPTPSTFAVNSTPSTTPQPTTTTTTTTNQNHVQLPSLFNSPTPSNSTTTSPWNMPNNPFSTINPGVPPYQAYMNMFQHLQNYYVQPLEEENKKLRKELSDSTRSVAVLKEENRSLRDTMMVHRPDEHFLDQLKSYQYEISCAPSFLSFEDDEEASMYDEEAADEELNSLPPRGIRQAMKFMKFRANVKLVLLKHNGTHWFEPIDRVSSTHYVDGERIGIRIINKNRFPVMVRLHKINHASSCISIPLTSEDFLRINGCREEEGNWETAYFDLGQCKLPKDQMEAVEMLKLLVTTALSAHNPDRLSTIAVKSFTIRTPSPPPVTTSS